MEALRRQFEAVCEKPFDVVWAIKSYVPRGPHTDEFPALMYNAKWSGFQLAHSIMGREREGHVLHYGHWIGSIEWSEQDKMFHGRVLHIKDLVIYDGTLDGLYEAFVEAVHSYVQVCDEFGDGYISSVKALLKKAEALSNAGER